MLVVDSPRFRGAAPGREKMVMPLTEKRNFEIKDERSGLRVKCLQFGINQVLKNPEISHAHITECSNGRVLVLNIFERDEDRQE